MLLKMTEALGTVVTQKLTTWKVMLASRPKVIDGTTSPGNYGYYLVCIFD
jgi:hypothetical protein